VGKELNPVKSLGHMGFTLLIMFVHKKRVDKMKKSCRVDNRRFDNGMCTAYEWPEKGYHPGTDRNESCNLGYKIKDGRPLEQCPKPKSESEFMEIIKKG